MEKLNLIIKHWPSNESDNTRRKRAMRVAQEMLPNEKVGAGTILSETQLREIIQALPVNTKGLEEALRFLREHSGLPAEEWRDWCGGTAATQYADELKALKQENEQLASELRTVRRDLQRTRDTVQTFQGILRQAEARDVV